MPGPPRLVRGRRVPVTVGSSAGVTGTVAGRFPWREGVRDEHDHAVPVCANGTAPALSRVDAEFGEPSDPSPARRFSECARRHIGCDRTAPNTRREVPSARNTWASRPECAVAQAFTLPAPLVDRLLAGASRAGLTFDTLVTTAWALVLAHVTGSDEVVFGIASALCAAGSGTARTVRLFDTATVRSRLRPWETLAELAAGIRTTPAETSDTAVLFVDVPTDVDEPREHETEIHSGVTTFLDHHTTLVVVRPRAGRPSFCLVVHPPQAARFGNAERWWDRFYAACTALTDAPGRTVAATDLLPGDERRTVLSWSGGVFILDPMMRPCPPLVPGEIYLSDDHAADRDHAEPTAARLVACPFGPPGTRMYRTGRRGHWDRSGTLRR